MSYDNNEFCTECGKPMPWHQQVLDDERRQKDEAEAAKQLELAVKDRTNPLYWRQVQVAGDQDFIKVGNQLACELASIWVAIQDLQKGSKNKGK
jgi:hypothetical protein